MTDRTHEAENRIELERLRSLIASLTDEEMSRAMPAGWTVAGVLAHMALWDARAVYWLDQWDSGTEPAPPSYETAEDVEWVNNAAKPLCLALPPREAARLALGLAEETDRRVAAMGDALLERVQALGCPFNLSRAEHRREHLDDIERALGLER